MTLTEEQWDSLVALAQARPQWTKDLLAEKILKLDRERWLAEVTGRAS